MKNTLYVTDLDGTLLKDNQSISKYSVDIINSYIEKGYLFTFATARSLYSAKKLINGLQLRLPVIVYNGCHILNPESFESVSSEFFTKQECDDLYQLFKKYRKQPIVYSRNKTIEKVYYLADQQNIGLMHYIDSRRNDKRFERKKQLKELMQGDIFYFTLIANKEDLFDLYQTLKQSQRFSIVYYLESYTNQYWLEIMPRLVNKATAIQKLKNILQCDTVVCFGDDINDLEMFDIADYKYAVANAKEQVKEKATAIIKSNNDDAVANWMKEHLK